jgi:hypothetical protein
MTGGRILVSRNLNVLVPAPTISNAKESRNQSLVKVDLKSEPHFGNRGIVHIQPGASYNAVQLTNPMTCCGVTELAMNVP